MAYPLRFSRSAHMPQHLALFDLDHTLLPLDSDVLWAEVLVDRGVVDAAWHSRRNNEFFQQYKEGRLNIAEFLEFQLGPLGKHSRATLDAWHAAFMAEKILPAISTHARALVDRHRRAGDLVVMITATNEFVTRPIAEAFGIPNLIATELEVLPDGNYTGKPRGVPSFREGKVTRLVQWLASQQMLISDFESSTFYTDSLNDLPLMLQVSHPVACNPDATLREHACAAGWPVLELFTSTQT